MKKQLKFFLFIFLIGGVSCTLPAYALDLTESFTSSAHKNTSDMVWNSSLGELHPPLQVEGWDDGFGLQNTAFTVGDGRNGAFTQDRYALFDSDGIILADKIIVIDTDQFPDLQFTSFNLASGYSIRPVGSQPLKISSLSSVIIAGVIDCSGEDGEAASAVVSALRSGGVAHCGSGSGGASVLPATSPVAVNNGASGGAGALSVGQGGPIALPSGGQGGGGGGAFVKDWLAPGDKLDPTSGDDSLGGVGGIKGNNLRDDSFTLSRNGAGSGGGGGSASADSSGGGGGAGGGSIQIYAVGDITISATGAVYANGGAGGSIGGGLKGGGGGGGGGGSILMLTVGDIVTDGPITAAAGSGGATAGGVGGTGAWGRTWIVDKDLLTGGVVEDPPTNLNLSGAVDYESGVVYTVESTAIDLGNTKPLLLTTPMTVQNLGASILTYELAFSDDGQTFGAYDLAANYLTGEVKRYVRFRITVDNTSTLTPLRILDISYTYTGFEQSEFNFTTGCGRVAAGGTPPFSLFGFLFMLPFLYWIRLTLKLKNHQSRPI